MLFRSAATQETEISSLRANITAANATIPNLLALTTSIIPTTDITVNLGSPTLRFGELYLGGSSLYVGNATVTTDPTTGAVAIVPAATTYDPNPIGLVIGPYGTISTVSSIAGVVTAANIAVITASSSALVYIQPVSAIV